MIIPGENGEVSFRLINPSDTPVILYKGSAIGKFEQLASHTDVVALTPDTESYAKEAPPHYQSGVPHPAAVVREKCQSIKNFHLQFKSLPRPTLTTAENAQLAELLQNFSDIFASSSLDLGHTQIIQHEIGRC